MTAGTGACCSKGYRCLERNSLRTVKTMRDVDVSGVPHLQCVLLRSWLHFRCRGKTSEAPLDQVCPGEVGKNKCLEVERRESSLFSRHLSGYKSSHSNTVPGQQKLIPSCTGCAELGANLSATEKPPASSPKCHPDPNPTQTLIDRHHRVLPGVTKPPIAQINVSGGADATRTNPQPPPQDMPANSTTRKAHAEHTAMDNLFFID